MRPLRRKKQFKTIDDLRTGNERILELSHENDYLSADGSVDTIGKQKLVPNDCGCLAPPGGRCAVCGVISCCACHGRCQRCAKPICQQDSVFVDPAAVPDLQLPHTHVVAPLQAKVRLCHSCAGAVGRQRRLGRIVRLLLKPFFEEPSANGR
jgi:hypothetical protein